MQTHGHPVQRSWLGPAVAIGSVAVGSALIAAWNPGDTGQPLCTSQLAFGVDCPFCGGMRCVNSLVRGDVLAAADHNVLLAVALPLVAIGLAVWLWRSMHGQTTPVPWPTERRRSMLLGAAIVVGLVVFTVLRNVGGPPWVEWLHSTSYLG